MRTKFSTIILTFVLLVALTACGKKEETPEPEKQLPKFGFREYQFDSDEGTRWLEKKYENLGTERTLSQYDDEGAVSIVKWYYDSTGEHLLKCVNWSRYEPTTSDEYDMNGRLIRKSVRQMEMEDGSGWYRELLFPDEYATYSAKENGNVGLVHHANYVSVKSNVHEIVTEYTYVGESDTIKGIKTVTAAGDVIGLLERGEGDIVLNALIDGEYVHYEETFDAEQGVGKYNYSFISETEYGEKSHGSKQYTSSGLLVNVFVQDDQGPNEGRTIEVAYGYDSDGGYDEYELFRDSNGAVYLYSKSWFDADGKCLREETKSDTLVTEVEYSYYENGNLSRHAEVNYFGSMTEESSRYEREYNEDGTFRSSRAYNAGKLTEENIDTYIEMPGVAGQVLCSKAFRNNYDECYNEVYYSIQMPNDYEPGKTKQVVFRTERENDAGKMVCCQQGIFDSEGRLIRIEDGNCYDVTKAEINGILIVTEFDEKGRQTTAYTRYWPNSNYNGADTMKEEGTVREYWEGEDPLAAEEAEMLNSTVTETP